MVYHYPVHIDDLAMAFLRLPYNTPHRGLLVTPLPIEGLGEDQEVNMQIRLHDGLILALHLTAPGSSGITVFNHPFQFVPMYEGASN